MDTEVKDNSLINEKMSKREIIEAISKIDSKIKRYNSTNEIENARKLEQKKAELNELLKSRKNSVSNQENKELGILKENISEQRNTFLKEKNRLDLITSEVDNVVLGYAKDKMDRKKLQAPNEKYGYGEIKVIADKINDNSIFARIMKFLKLNGYNSNVNMAMDLLTKINSTKYFLDHKIMKIEQEYKAQSQKIKAKYRELSNKQEITVEEKEECENELRRLKKEFEEQRREFINSLKIKESFDNLNQIFTKFYYSEILYNDYKQPMKSEDRILFGTLDFKLNNDYLIQELIKIGVEDYKFVRVGEKESSIEIPVLKDINSLKLLFHMSNRQNCLEEGELAQFLREFCYRYIRALPLDEINITYIDPESRGSNSGFLQKLAVDEKCRVVNQIVTSEEMISSKIHQLEQSIDQVIQKIMGYKDVKSYNESETEKVPYQLVVINDFPNGFSSTSLEKLKIIVKNAAKCGISIVMTIDSRTYKDEIGKYRETGEEIDKLINNEFEMFYKTETECYYDIETKAKIQLSLSNRNKLTVSEEKAFVSSVLEESKKVKAMDNSFETYKEKLVPTVFRDSVKEGLQIPFAINNKGNLVSLKLSGSSSNALLSGNIGSGKSTTLHALITSIITNYSPDDVELWLVDYKKVEFTKYVNNRPPHVKLIGLDKSLDFSYSLLRAIKEEFESRMDKFREVVASDISDYRQKCPDKPMPRIVLIVDEFHNLTQAIQSESEYMIMLENALSEYRAFGFSCILSDQAISDGLRGLSDKARQQIISRLAMHNEMPEVKETLAMNSSYYTDEVNDSIRNLTVGDVIFKQEIVNEASEKEVVIDKYKVINISDDDRENIIDELKVKLEGKYQAKEVIIVDSPERKERNEEVIDKYETKMLSSGKATIPIYLGTTMSLDPCFAINLYKETDANMMFISSENEIRYSIIINAIKSFVRQKTSKVNVFIEPNNEIYSSYKDDLYDIKNSQVSIYTDMSEICDIISEEEDKVISNNNTDPILNIWVGFEDLYEQFLELPEKDNNKPKSKATVKTENSSNMYSGLLDNLEAIASKYSDNKSIEEEKEIEESVEDEESDSNGYNALDDIETIIKKGTKKGIYTLMLFDSIRNLNRIRILNQDEFQHKMGYRLSSDDSNMFIGRMSSASSVDDKLAVYSNGGSKFKTFIPYK